MPPTAYPYGDPLTMRRNPDGTWTLLTVADPDDADDEPHEIITGGFLTILLAAERRRRELLEDAAEERLAMYHDLPLGH
jgi:hypothetical protein